MALKLGEILIKEKMITPEQLEEALTNHLFYGVRLGSSLVELGYVEEDALARLLSEKLGVPCAKRSDLAGAAPDAISALPRELASKYHVVPFRLEKNRLSIAMSDPTDFRAVEEMAFITGHVIKTFIAPDVLISKAMAKYYRLSTGEARYQQVALKRKKSASVLQDANTITIPTISETGELLNVTIPAEFEGFASLPDMPDALEDIKEDIRKYTVDGLSMDFASARSRDDVANLFIKYLGQEFKICGLFIIRGNAAAGWRAVINGERLREFEELSIMLSKPSILRDLLESKEFHMGTLINTPENRMILQKLGAGPVEPLLALPIVMHGKVVAVVLVSADMAALGRRLAELQKLVRKASLAFEMLIIKNKILMT